MQPLQVKPNEMYIMRIMTINLIKKDYIHLSNVTVGTSLYIQTIPPWLISYLPLYLPTLCKFYIKCVRGDPKLVLFQIDAKEPVSIILQKYVNLHVHIMKRSPLHPYLKSSKWKLGKLNVKIVVWYGSRSVMRFELNCILL